MPAKGKPRPKGAAEEKPKPKAGPLARTGAQVPACATFAKYEIARAEPEMMQALRENLEGDELTQFDLTRIRVPAGGGIAWELPGESDDEPEVAKEFTALILLTQSQRAYWSVQYDETGGGTPPDCASADGVAGIGDPGGVCERCPYSKFGTALGRDGENRRGQACRQVKLLFVMLRAGLLPVVLPLPPTSLKAYKSYAVGRLGTRGIVYYGCLTRFTLAKVQSSDGIDYSQVRFAMAERLSLEQAAAVKALRGELAPVFTRARSAIRVADFEPEASSKGVDLPSM